MPLLFFAVWEVPQASMDCSPFELIFRHHPQGLLDIVCEGWQELDPHRRQVPR